MYGAMNILSFVALRNISAGLFTIIAQTKVFTTAVFSSLILQRRYTATQWRALVALVLGVLLFTEPVWNSSKFTGTSLTQGGGDASQEHQLWKQDHQRPWLGTMAVMMEVTMSGFASIYFEKVIKIDPLQLSIWERNFQLALGSVPVYLLFILQENVGGTTQSGHGPGSGWTPLAVVVAALGAAGGLLVALSIKYGDSILKTLATTGAIILSSVLDHVWLRGPLTPTMMIAGCQVIFAICNYTFDATPPVSPAAAKAAAAVTSPLAMEAAKKDTTDQIASQPDEEMVPLMLRPAPSSESTGMSKRQATKAEMSDDS
jgi:UDP-sugar transporter A1/2/3